MFFFKMKKKVKGTFIDGKFLVKERKKMILGF
jgi:hypothetical protein